MARLRLAVFVSGRGANLQALIDSCARPDFPAEIGLVVSNRPDAAGLARAGAAGVPARTIDHRAFPDRGAFERALDEAVAGAGCGLVCLAGFMRLLTSWFVDRWRDRLVNVHPSLLPAYRGLDAHRRVIEDGGRITGCTVHFVRPAMDDGPVLVQAAVPVLDGDDPDRLAARVLEAERRCYPLAVRLIAEGRVRVRGRRVEIDGPEAPPGAPLIAPPPGR